MKTIIESYKTSSETLVEEVTDEQIKKLINSIGLNKGENKCRLEKRLHLDVDVNTLTFDENNKIEMSVKHLLDSNKGKTVLTVF